MNSHNLGKQVAEFENTPEGYAYSLRLDLAEIILRHLNSDTMTQTQLAEKAQKSQQMVTRIIHAASNCTLETAAHLLFALGVKPKLVEDVPAKPWLLDQGGMTATNTSSQIEYKSLSLDSQKRATLPVGESRLHQPVLGFGR